MEKRQSKTIALLAQATVLALEKLDYENDYEFSPAFLLAQATLLALEKLNTKTTNA